MTHVPQDWADAELAWQQQGRSAASPEESYRQALAVRLVQDGIAAFFDAILLVKIGSTLSPSAPSFRQTADF